MKPWIVRFKGLVQWFMQLEPQEHRHWCMYYVGSKYSTCKHRSYCWMCSGLFCSHLERKNCPECEEANATMEAQP